MTHGTSSSCCCCCCCRRRSPIVVGHFAQLLLLLVNYYEHMFIPTIVNSSLGGHTTTRDGKYPSSPSSSSSSRRRDFWVAVQFNVSLIFQCFPLKCLIGHLSGGLTATRRDGGSLLLHHHYHQEEEICFRVFLLNWLIWYFSAGLTRRTWKARDVSHPSSWSSGRRDLWVAIAIQFFSDLLGGFPRIPWFG